MFTSTLIHRSRSYYERFTLGKIKLDRAPIYVHITQVKATEDAILQ